MTSVCEARVCECEFAEHTRAVPYGTYTWRRTAGRALASRPELTQAMYQSRQECRFSIHCHTLPQGGWCMSARTLCNAVLSAVLAAMLSAALWVTDHFRDHYMSHGLNSGPGCLLSIRHRVTGVHTHARSSCTHVNWLLQICANPTSDSSGSSIASARLQVYEPVHNRCTGTLHGHPVMHLSLQGSS